MKRIVIGLLAGLLLAPAFAIDSEAPFRDPALETRYENLIHDFRCLVCQNETVADSDADLAADFRRQIRGMVAAGKTDEEIRSYMVARYGDFVLYKPPVQIDTWLLWGGPFLFLAIGLAVGIRVLRRRAAVDSGQGAP
ncbi:MAG TPA: cytochrome c-type biogenesis protein [Gammaproteobacteria bacterium]|nr:cytochrome c-type biogenesis protein [Gammaproteobacteria bacterium]